MFFVLLPFRLNYEAENVFKFFMLMANVKRETTTSQSGGRYTRIFCAF